MKPAIACAGTNSVHEAGVLVPDNIVGVTHFIVVGGFFEVEDWIGRLYVAKLSEVKYLHSMVSGLANNEGKVVVHLKLIERPNYY